MCDSTFNLRFLKETSGESPEMHIYVSWLSLGLRTCFSYFNEREFIVLGWDSFLFFGEDKNHKRAYGGLHLSAPSFGYETCF